jgi:hypothetical protein
MLISMPTGTSTIFGVFQAIADLPKVFRPLRRDCRQPPKNKAAPSGAQAAIAGPAREQWLVIDRDVACCGAK